MNTCPVDRKKFYCIKLYLQLNGKCIGEVSIIKSCVMSGIPYSWFFLRYVNSANFVDGINS